MTCRSLLWIAAVAAPIVAATSNPSVVAAEPGPGWTITIDEPTAAKVVESKHLTIKGAASNEAGVDGVTVTVVPQDLPPQCGPETGPASLDGGGYSIELDVACNGPYRIEVVANGPSGSAAGEPRAVGVAERAPRPAAPGLDVTGEDGLRATWDPGDDPDAAGTVLVVDFREDLFGPGIGEAILPPADRNASVAVRALRWGADGPGGTAIASPESGGNYIGPEPPPPSEPPDPPDPTELPPSESPATPPKPPPTGGGPSSALPPSPNSSDNTTATPSTTTLPAEPSEAPAFVPLSERNRRPSSDTEERATLTGPAGGGLVRTSDERSPGFIAPLALALLIITIAAQIVWHTRRRPHLQASARPITGPAP